MWFRCILVLFMHYHIKMHLISSHSDLIQMWLRFISVSSVHHHIKLHFVFLLFRFDSDVFLFHQCFIIIKYVSLYFVLSSFSFNSHLILFFSSSCKSSVFERRTIVMMSDHHFSSEHKICRQFNLISSIS